MNITHTLMILATVSTMAACSSEGTENEPAASADAISDDAPAEVTSMKIEHTTAGCSVSISQPRIDGKTPAATLAMTRSMPAYDAELLCSDVGPKEHLRVVGTYEVRANRAGIVSVFMGLSSGEIDTRTYDTATGRRLLIGDVINADGQKAVHAACEAWLANTGAFDADEARTTCDEGMTGDDVAFVLESNGLRLSLRLPPAAASVGSEGVLVAWSALPGVKPALAAFAKRD